MSRFKNNFFSIELPPNWSQYKDDENTYAFFNKNEWSGNLRITPVKNLSKNIMEERSTTITGAEFSKSMEGIVYNELNDDNILIYYWEFYKKGIYFICSFSFDISLLSKKSQIEELKSIEKALNTIKVVLP